MVFQLIVTLIKCYLKCFFNFFDVYFLKDICHMILPSTCNFRFMEETLKMNHSDPSPPSLLPPPNERGRRLAKKITGPEGDPLGWSWQMQVSSKTPVRCLWIEPLPLPPKSATGWRAALSVSTSTLHMKSVSVVWKSSTLASKVLSLYFSVVTIFFQYPYKFT